MRDDRAQAGFTLLEVIVALVIAAVAMAVLFSGAATGLRATHLSGDTMKAVSLARSHLAMVGRARPLVPGEQSGEDGDGFHWRLRITPLASVPFEDAQNSAAASGSPPRLVLFAVAVAVSWSMDGGTRQVVLDTQRVGTMAPAAP